MPKVDRFAAVLSTFCLDRQRSVFCQLSAPLVNFRARSQLLVVVNVSLGFRRGGAGIQKFHEYRVLGIQKPLGALQ